MAERMRGGKREAADGKQQEDGLEHLNKQYIIY